MPAPLFGLQAPTLLISHHPPQTNELVQLGGQSGWCGSKAAFMWKGSHGGRQSSHVLLEEGWHIILNQRETVASPALITDTTDDSGGHTEPGCMFTSVQAAAGLADEELH